MMTTFETKEKKQQMTCTIWLFNKLLWTFGQHLFNILTSGLPSHQHMIATFLIPGIKEFLQYGGLFLEDLRMQTLATMLLRGGITDSSILFYQSYDSQLM